MKGLVRNIFAICLCLFILQFFIGAGIIYYFNIQQTTQNLQQASKRIKGDINYSNGTWDMRKYNSDPLASDTHPVYILSATGYVVERWRPIHGFLDTSDENRLLQYGTAQTITVPTNQIWRILSKPYLYRGQVLGVMTVAYFNPVDANILAIDKKLSDTLSLIQRTVQVKNNNIDASNLDVRNISYDVTFQIVDKFNRIILKNNNSNSIDRIPDYIDPSYVREILKDRSIQQVDDDQTHETFLLVTTPLVDSNDTVDGVIVVGKSVEYVYQQLHNYFLWEGVSVAILVFLLGIFLAILNRVYITKPETPPENKVQRMTFLPEQSRLRINDIETAIPRNTNQYNFLQAVFEEPQKRWETDELLEKFGEEIKGESWRKVYDAMVIINRKFEPILHMKLIVTRDRTYQLNPLLTSKVN